MNPLNTSSLFDPASQQARTVGAAPRVLVLLATFNGAKWLEEQLESIFNQVGVELHLLVSDDASTDGSAQLLEKSLSRRGNAHFLTKSEASGSAGANFRSLFRQADSRDFEYVALADQDDIWSPEKIQSAVRCLVRHRAEGYSSAVQSFDDGGPPTNVLAQNPHCRSADFIFEGAGQGCTFVLTSAAFRAVQGFCIEHADLSNALHYHDWLIYLLTRAKRGTWYFDQTPHMHYRQHTGNEIGARGGLAAIKKRLALIRRGWYGQQIRSAAHIYLAAGGDDPTLLRAMPDIAAQGRRGFWTRMRFAAFTLQHGRRRFSDRAVLAVCVLLGWL